ncbi:hypothetical protein BGZ76_010252 [Entomortierella beljakovae]|nr:hypothetical protein BGZ76_010252 [Entomortierella beljakovae]
MSHSSESSFQTVSDSGDGPLMTKSSNNSSKENSSSQKSNKPHKDDDRANWVNGKKPKGYRTPEGREAAEKSKQYKSGATVPHLVHNCNTYEGVFKHAVLGAIRSGGITYGGKALINLCLGLLKVMKKRSTFGKVLKDAFIGADAIRFGSFFAAFSFLWKFVNNGAKLYRGKDDRINGAIAGAIAGLAILVENPERRVTFAQQMFMRSIQGAYNAGKYRGQFSFRHGDALLFALASAQVMYAYTMYPDTIPKEFYGFMVKTARVPAEGLALNRANVRGFPLDLKQVRAYVDNHRPTKHTIEVVSNMKENVDAIPCALLHPWVDSCRETNMERFTQVTKEILPVYATLNIVPLLVLRLKKLLKDPANIMTKTTINTLRSSVFLAIFVAGYQTQICSHRNLLKAGFPLGNSKYLYGLFGFICSGASIMCEQESRRAELAMYVLPKAAGSLYQILQSKNLVAAFKYWEVLMFSFSSSLIMSFYQHEDHALSPFVTRLIYHIFGMN